MHNYLKINNNIYNALQNSQEFEGENQFYLTEKNYHIYTYRYDVFTYTELDQIITLGKRLSLRDSVVGPDNVLRRDIRVSSISWMGYTPSRLWLFKKLRECVIAQNENFYNYDLSHLGSLQFTHYNSCEKGYYSKHLDPLVHTKPHNRKLSFVVQLSDPSDYEGGDLTLYMGGEDGTVVAKGRGLVHFFPSHCLHEVTPVTAGERYSLVGWVHGAPLK
jgi:PKHD-type hydroxylase